MNEEKEIELLPCPFCLEEAYIVQRPNTGYWDIGCKNPDCCGWTCTDKRCRDCKDGWLEKNVIINKWNTRKHPPCNHVELDRDELEKFIYNFIDYDSKFMVTGTTLSNEIYLKFSQPKEVKIKLPTVKELAEITQNTFKKHAEQPISGEYINLRTFVAEAILQHIKEINGIKE